MLAKDLMLEKEALTGGGRIILKKVAPDYEYHDGVRDTSKVIGQRVTVILPDNGYVEQVVRVANPRDSLSDLLKQTAKDKRTVYVDFIDFSASVYCMADRNGRWTASVSAKAADVVVVDDRYEVELDD